MALVVKNLPASAGDIRDVASIPGLGRSPGGGHVNPLQYSCLENPMDRGAWQATVPRVTKSRRWLKQLARACTVDLQCCAYFCSQQSDSVIHMYRHFFSYSFPLWFITAYWILFLVLYRRTLLFIHPTYNSLHLLIPGSQSFPPHLPTTSATTSLISMFVSLFLFHRYVHLCRVLDSTYR